jgi:hypothetical protein
MIADFGFRATTATSGLDTGRGSGARSGYDWIAIQVA